MQVCVLFSVELLKTTRGMADSVVECFWIKERCSATRGEELHRIFFVSASFRFIM